MFWLGTRSLSWVMIPRKPLRQRCAVFSTLVIVVKYNRHVRIKSDFSRAAVVSATRLFGSWFNPAVVGFSPSFSPSSSPSSCSSFRGL